MAKTTTPTKLHHRGAHGLLDMIGLARYAGFVTAACVAIAGFGLLAHLGLWYPIGAFLWWIVLMAPWYWALHVEHHARASAIASVGRAVDQRLERGAHAVGATVVHHVARPIAHKVSTRDVHAKIQRETTPRETFRTALDVRKERQIERDTKPRHEMSRSERDAWYRKAWKHRAEGPLGRLTKVEHVGASTVRYHVTLPKGMTVFDGHLNPTAVALLVAFGGACGVSSSQVVVKEDRIGVALIEIRYDKREPLPVTPHPILKSTDAEVGSIDKGLHFGFTREGPASIRLRNTHTLINGTTGAGKSSVVRSVLLDLIMLKVQGVEVIVWLWDAKRELLAFKPYVDRYAQTVDEAELLFRSGIAEMERREIATQGEASNWSGPMLVVIADEFATMPQSLQEETVLPIAQRGRSAVIHLMLTTLRATKDTIPAALRNLFDQRVILHCSDDSELRWIADSKLYTNREHVPDPGDFLLKIGGNYTTGKSYRVEKEDAFAFLNKGISIKPAESAPTPLPSALPSEGAESETTQLDPPTEGADSAPGKSAEDQIRDLFTAPAALDELPADLQLIWITIRDFNTEHSKPMPVSALADTLGIAARTLERRQLPDLESRGLIEYAYRGSIKAGILAID